MTPALTLPDPPLAAAADVPAHACSLVTEDLAP